MSVVESSLWGMIIDCESCALFDPALVENPACNDCVVSVIISMDTLTRKIKPEIPDETEEALALLSSRGIVPPLRFNPVNFG